MRSRYSAFALRLIDYLIFTSSKALNSQQSRKNLRHWAKANTWMNLEILYASNDQVTFKAYYKDQNQQKQVHHERSYFIREDGQWKYDKGLINPAPEVPPTPKNAPCPCGSEKKYKKCGG